MLHSTCQQSWKTQQRPQTDKGQCSFQTQTRAMPKNAQFSSVQLLSHVQLFATPWTAACQASLFITNSWSLCKLMSIQLVMPSNLSSSVIPFSSHFQSFLASGFFSVSQFFTSAGQRMFKLPKNCAHSHASKVMPKILEARLQKFVNQELPDVQSGFRKGRGARDHSAIIGS